MPLYTPFRFHGLKLIPPPKCQYKKFIPPPLQLQNQDQSPVEAFLGLIGRGCSQWSAKFPTWQHLFQATGAEMREYGIPISIRKYILKWTHYYRLGKMPIEYPMDEKQAKKKRFPLATVDDEEGEETKKVGE